MPDAKPPARIIRPTLHHAPWLGTRSRPHLPGDQRGQVLVLFVLMVMAICFMAALLFDGAELLVNRRVLQDAADLGAVAGANLIQNEGGCNSTVKSVAVANAQNYVNASGALGSTPTISASCPSGYENNAVRVTINGSSPSFFGPALRLAMSAAEASAWTSGIPVQATGTAMHGPAPGNKYSVVELNPYNSTWQSGLRGCPSVLFAGSATITFEGSLHSNSACAAADNGALSTNGGPTVIFTNGAHASLTGGYASSGISPYPLTDQPRLRDPLRNMPSINVASLPIRSSSQLTVNGKVAVLQPGRYIGGIRLQSTAQVFLLPGIYVLDTGGINVGSQASLMSIPTSLGGIIPPTSVTTWTNDCRPSSCGVLIYNYRASRNADQITVGGGATVLLRPYAASADSLGSGIKAYNNLLIWQDASPAPTSSFIQPPINLNGGGTINISGTLYAPSAKVYMTGGSGGSGGDALDLTLQFISWDLQIQGNSSFYFHYTTDTFTRPIAYGLIE
ncbi:MAG: Tad domain-containing protein [Candidatus Limnocylindrales bacterium]